MKNILQKYGKCAVVMILLTGGIQSLKAQTFPMPGFTLPNGETIYITYEVDVNANIPDNVCQISNQSSVSGSNFMTVLTDDPDITGLSNPTITPRLLAADITDCPNDTTVYNTVETCSESMSFVAQAVGCPSVTITYQVGGMNITFPHFFPEGVTVVSVIASSGTPPNDTCMFTVTVLDTIDPVITCNDLMLQLDAMGNASFTLEDITSGIADNCGIGMVSILSGSSIFTCADADQTFTIIVQVTDINGNTATCSSSVEIDDDQNPCCDAPVAMCQDITVGANPMGVAIIPAANLDNGSVIDCGLDHYTATPPSISCPVTNPTVVTLTITDLNGNTATCTANVTVIDTFPPMMTCPSNTSIECDDSTLPAFTGSPTVVDCDPNPTVTSADVTVGGLCPREYTITRTWTATDALGRSSSCVQTIMVFDVTAPALTCPGALNLQCANQVPTPNITLVTSTDNCPGGITITHVSDVTVNQTCPNRYTLNRTYRATDACGNSATCNQTITVFDNTIPTLTCPAPVTVQCASLVPANDPLSVVASDNCGGTAAVTFVGDVITNQTCIDRYTVTRTYRATDLCNNSATCTQTITVFDNTLPTLTCPAPVNVQCASQVPPFDVESVTATDNCGGPALITFGGDITTNQTCVNRFTVTRTYNATDACGNTGTCTQTITVFDDTPPTLNCPEDVTVECASQVPFPDVESVSSSDNCDGFAPISFDGDVTVNQTCPNRYTLIRTYRATDACGNSATCTQTITVFDDIVPFLTCPGFISVSCANQVPTPNPGSIGSTDNCGGSATITHVSDVISGQSCANRYTVTRTYRATDACGNSATCTQTIVVFDSILPLLTCPANTNVQCANQVPTPDIGSVTSTDNCGEPAIITHVSDVTVNQTCPNRYTLNRTYLATDACGNSATCNQTITVFDNTVPTLTCPAPVTVQCASLVPAFNTGSVTSSDNCGGSAAVTFDGDVISGQTCTNRFIVTRTYRATDLCNNSATCTQTITVFDNTAPLLTCPAAVTVQCASQVPPFDVESVTSTDNCGGPAPITFGGDVITNQICVNRFTVTRTYWATDVCGNTGSCIQTITVFDNTPPTLTCPGGVTVQCANQVPTPDITLVTSTDNCAGGTTITHVSDVTVNQTCPNRYTLNRTYRATDVCGNSATCNQTIIIFDNTVPTLTCPAPVTVQCANQVPAVNPGSVSTSDNCGGPAPVVTHVADVTTNQTCFNRYILTRTYRSTDACGNSATCNQTITVFDNTVPTLTCPAPVTVQCANLVPIINTLSVVTSDNCGGPAPVVTHVADVTTNQTCFNRYILTRTYRSTDACGNSATCNQTITVFDNTAPSITCPANLTVQCAALVPAVNTGSVVTSDNCGGPAPVVTFVSDVTTNQTCINRFILTRTYRSTDACGNSATCAQVITVFDNTPPVITFTHPLLQGVPNGGTIEVQCFGQDPEFVLPTFNESSVSVTDNCAGTITVTFAETLQDEGNCPVDGYINQYRLTWTATDACGNSSTRFVLLELIDTIPPELQGVPDDITVNCDEIPEPPNANDITATDECLCACVILFDETDPAPGCQDGQVIVRSWTARDDCGNETIETQNITLVDEEGPELLITQPEIAGTPDGTILNYSCNEGGIPDFYDLLSEESVFSPVSCGGSSIISFTSNNVETRNCEFFGYMEQRNYQWIGVDQCGNETSLTITVRLIDDEPPVLINVPEIVCVGDPALDEVEAIDNCGNGNFFYWDVEIPNPCGNGKAYRRTYEGFDPCGNTVSGSSILIPNDHTNPIIKFVNPVLAELKPGEVLLIDCAAHEGQYTPFGIDDVSVEDGCTAGIDVNFSERVLETHDCSTNGIIAIMELEWTATDICGNLSTLTIQAFVIDNTSPVFVNFDPEVTIGCNDPMPVNFATDNCGEVSITTEETIVPGSCDYEYDVLRQVTATDPCGNSTTELQTIHVGDGSGPIIEGVVVELCDDLSIPDVTAYDPCAGEFVEVTMKENELDVPCRDGSVIERVWTAVDICGNITHVRQIIITNDHTPPEILIPTYSVIRKFMDNSYNLIFLSQTGLVNQLDDLDVYSVFVEDECDQAVDPVFTLEISYADDCDEDGYFERRIYTWAATDVCGNSSSITFSVDIMDDIPPVFSGVPDDVTIICEQLPPAAAVLTDDPAQPVTIVYTESIDPTGAPGTFVVTRTWTATDACGNSSVAVHHIFWTPDTFLDCDIILPDLVDCNSHGVGIGSSTSGGIEPLTYEWEVVGEKCFIQDGQGTPEILIYIGFSEVEITLTMTDAFGCVTVCTTTLDCLFTFDNLISGPPSVVSPETDHNPVVPTPAVSSPKEYLQQLNLWPNPANGSVNLSFESAVEDEVEFSFMNFLGQVVISDKISAHKGFNTHKIEVAQIPQGSYMMEVKTEREMYTKVIVIMRND